MSSDEASNEKKGAAFEAQSRKSVQWLLAVGVAVAAVTFFLQSEALGFDDVYSHGVRDSLVAHPILWTVGIFIFISFCLKSSKKTKVPGVSGFCDAEFEHVRQVYSSLVDTGKEMGSSFSAYYEGRQVVNLWAGYADKDAEEPWREDTISMWYSTSKGVTGIVMAHLNDRGLLDFDKPVCYYWPEFAANGKENITVKQLLTHQGGLAAIEEPYSMASLQEDPDKLGEILANQRPNWPPGSGHGYHNVSLALYADQIVRRVDDKNRSLSAYFQDEIALKFDIDFTFGLRRKDHFRKARQVNFFRNFLAYFPPWVLYKWMWAEMQDKNSVSKKMKGNPTDWISGNNPRFQEHECGSTHGFGTANALAKLYGILANGGGFGRKRLLSKSTIEKLEKPVTSGPDLTMRIPITWGLSGSVVKVQEGQGDSHSMFGCGGFGGQMAMADSHYKVGWAYLTNYMNVYHGFTIDERYQALQDALYECVRKRHNRSHLPLELSWG